MDNVPTLDLILNFPDHIIYVEGEYADTARVSLHGSWLGIDTLPTIVWTTGIFFGPAEIELFFVKQNSYWPFLLLLLQLGFLGI